MGRPITPRVVQRRFWQLIGEGLPTEGAGVRVGVSAECSRKWFHDAGGMPPMKLSPLSGRFLSLPEREEIAVGLAAGLSPAQIGRQLGRDRATISREIRRNRPRDRPRAAYRAGLAQSKAEARARRPKPSKLAGCPMLRAQVQDWLTKRWSPQQIAGRLGLDYPENTEMRVSHETIYRSLYIQGCGELNRELTRCLRTGRALRKPRQRVDRRIQRQRIPDMVMIADRPPEVEDRAVPGHWEGDLVIGAHSASAIGTLVERSSRFLLPLHLPGTHGAVQVRDAVTDTISTLPELLRCSLTWDQGIEMARHAEITMAAGMPIYFCDPSSPWQRGTNENINGLLRQYFPKGTDLSVHSAEHLAAVAAELNGRPRKILGWRTPAEIFAALLSGHDQSAGVATTT